MAAPIAFDGVVAGVFCGHDLAHGHDSSVGRCFVGLALGAGSSCTHLCSQSHGLCGPLALYTVIAYGFPGVLGGLVGGLLSDSLGLQSVYWVSMATALLATLAAYKVWRMHHPLANFPSTN